MDVKILSIVGWCRNGSTIIGNILGEVPGFVHVGELHFLWQNGSGRGVNSLCGCGLTLTECPVWSSVLSAELDGRTLDSFAVEVMRRQHAYARTRHTWRLLKQGPHNHETRAHADLLSRTYQAIAARTGARVIVDSSKIAAEAALLPHLPGVTPYYLHLVRDPRAVAHSWRAPKDYVYAMSATRSTLYWDGFNLAARALTHRFPERSMLLRYEDFIARPANAIDSLLSLCGADAAANPVAGSSVELGTNHTVTGNPDRFRSGITVIRDRDDSWKAGLPARARVAATLWSWPLFREYGYQRLAGAPRDIDAEEDTVGSGA